ncbi:hypothetical protein BLI708_04900 [Bifidobacterium imperatoris]|uniref:Uncharacterized protein n=1 Tax=Bifidobacterium imperatoris TaxID=2020965 RepID=A0A2N5ISM7_9BIFI|nr:hypothetical protein [Bifidobacterium imperatoris]PLS24963.1 hypothetical protein Tam1G_0819 [Bifidobacterium imperatoris]QSY58602.1 hypothetical protein BLI708_04900 [Bifidobacterium imperatoris]
MNETTGKIFTRHMLETALASALDMISETLAPPTVYEIDRKDIKALAGNVFVLGGIPTDISELEEARNE